jgi:TonB family protein
MAFRALLFSKNFETNQAMTAACGDAGIRVEACSDIFTAIEKGKKRAFSCVIADWADQPEASFLLKRARESAVNRDTIAVAVVDHDPTHLELRDNRLDFLIYRPISPEEADAVLAKACEKMQPLKAEDAADLGAENRASVSSPADSVDADPPQHGQETQPIEYLDVDPAEDDGGETASYEEEEEEAQPRSPAKGFRGVFVAVLVLATAFCVWRSHAIIEYLAGEQEVRSLSEWAASFFPAGKPAVSPANSHAIDGQLDADFNGDSSNGQKPSLGVVASESTLAETLIPLRKAPDFPLPMPTVERHEVAPIRKERAAIPDSMKNSAPIAPPVVVTVGPAQMMPVSAPQPQPAGTQQFSEPVAVNEEAERALLVHTVNPVYPTAALAQKLHGPVVLQARIGRDGSIEDLKIVRGYFILAQAAIAAVKQWRFQPYTLNGHAAATQTTITINFSYPPG